MPSLPLQAFCKNLILSSIPAETFQELAPYLVPMELGVGLTLHEPSKSMDAVFFLEDGICSVIMTMEDGVSVEVSVIGREGVVGTPILLGTGMSPHRSIMQVPGRGYRLAARVLIRVVDTSAGLRSCLMRSVHGLLVQTSQTAACNRLHELNGRLARWLLMCRDRVTGTELEITQEILAVMLGTGRTSVTLAAGALQRARLISYSRGRLTILNHAGLEKAACECYRAVHEDDIRIGLLPPRDFAGRQPGVTAVRPDWT